jgi:hypothetical protein
MSCFRRHTTPASISDIVGSICGGGVAVRLTAAAIAFLLNLLPAMAEEGRNTLLERLPSDSFEMRLLQGLSPNPPDRFDDRIRALQASNEAYWRSYYGSLRKRAIASTPPAPYIPYPETPRQTIEVVQLPAAPSSPGFTCLAVGNILSCN